ncbi:hypothetical protein JZL10_13400 [Staphylococcus aureus]|nr:hypothetical protein [Staphylococcus aureus]MCB8185413.1 hypothetical protein [Staphylococcus aureus]NGJ60654.1 hypothetical protein [Staphylococcus aureus]GBW46524.1 hypothetical protein M1K159_2408 [Staphylococcus aureus]HCX9385328.1 hypothetical protein [Staphylococcus aureus]HCY1462521.1 hypothetical protein [Staphylococcus aureus]
MEKENFLSIDIIRDDVNYWLIRTNGGDWYQDFKQNNHVSITNSIVSLCDLKEVNDIEKYKKIVTSKNQKKQKDLENSLTNLPEDEKQKILDKNNLSKRSITDLSKRLFDFIHKINIGDYVIIPNYRSFEFCIGIIISDATEYTDKNIHSLKINSQKNNYKFSNNKLHRKVKWLKHIPRNRINPKILNKLQMHQTIISLSEYKKHINYLINPIYIQNTNIHINIGINRTKDISPKLWYDFNYLIKLFTDTTSFKFNSQKIDVQSPGMIEFISQLPHDFIKEIYSNKEEILNLTMWLSHFAIFCQIFKGKDVKSIDGVEFQEKVPEDIKKLRNDAERERLKVEIARYKLDRMYIEQSTCDFKQRSSNVPEKFESEIKDANEDEANNDFDNR